jgi:hypothetical protein
MMDEGGGLKEKQEDRSQESGDRRKKAVPLGFYSDF